MAAKWWPKTIHLLVGSKSFHSREEIETLRAALTAIEWPDDELSVFAALKGSLFAISDSTLLLFRHQFKRLHPFGRHEENIEAEFQPVAEALHLLGLFGWVCCLFFLICCAWRLARFNVLSAGKPSTGWFTGLPSPSAGMTLAVYYPFSQTEWYRASIAYLDLQHQGLVVHARLGAIAPA